MRVTMPETCSECPIAVSLGGNRLRCPIIPYAVRGHWEPTIECAEAIKSVVAKRGYE
jgi:hypothetical protein